MGRTTPVKHRAHVPGQVILHGILLCFMIADRQASATTATPTRTPLPCVKSLAPAGPAHCCQFCSTTNTCAPPEGGHGCLQVAAPDSCCWQAILGRGGIAITSGQTGCGNGEVCYQVFPYFGDLGQVTELRVNQETFSVGQPRGGTPTNTATPTPTPTLGHCVESLEPSGQTLCCAGCSPANVCVSPTGDTGCFTVVADASCCWTAGAKEPFSRILSVTSGAAGCGGGEVCYSAAFNDSTSGRVGEITVDNQIFRVGQNRYPTASGTTPAPTQTPTATPTRPPCPCDCNGDYQVRVNELLIGINIALERAQLGACEAISLLPCGRPGEVCIQALVSCVDYALRGCP